MTGAFAHGAKRSKAIDSFYFDKKFEIVIDGMHAGHFYIRKAKKKKVLLDQTFHFSENLSAENISADYDEDGILDYEVDLGAIKYRILVDFHELDGADNAGLRITLPADDLEVSTLDDIETAEDFSVENIIVRRLISEDDSMPHAH